MNRRLFTGRIVATISAVPLLSGLTFAKQRTPERTTVDLTAPLLAQGMVAIQSEERARIAAFMWAVYEASTHGASGLMERAIRAVECGDMDDPMRIAQPRSWADCRDIVEDIRKEQHVEIVDNDSGLPRTPR